MAHKHSIYDTDAHFKVDRATREIKSASTVKTVLIQHDHNSERMTFEIPRMLDGHDISTCNVVQVHYLNIESANKVNQSAGIYEVADLQISPESDDVVICSWLVSSTATKYVGSLNFVIRFCCVSESGKVEYAWNTALCSSVSVSTGICNTEEIAEEAVDILAALEARIAAIESRELPEDVATEAFVQNYVANVAGKAYTAVIADYQELSFNAVHTSGLALKEPLVVGNNYKVEWGGSAIVCPCYGKAEGGQLVLDGAMLGNASLMFPAMPDTGESFFVGMFDAETFVMKRADDPTATIAIYGEEEMASMKDVEDFVSNYIKEALEGEF